MAAIGSPLGQRYATHQTRYVLCHWFCCLLGDDRTEPLLKRTELQNADAKEKVRVTDAFSGHRSLSTCGTIAILLGLAGVAYFFPASFKIAGPIAFGILLLFLVLIQATIVRRLWELGIFAQSVARFRVQAV